MSYRPALRKSLITAIAILATLVGIGGLASSPASASVDPGLVQLVLPARLAVMGVHSYSISPAYPSPWTDPQGIFPGDLVNVCSTVKNVGYSTSPVRPITVTGPTYNWVGSVPPLAPRSVVVVCTGYYSLHFSGIYAGVGGCKEIELDATVDGSYSWTTFFQSPCGGPRRNV